MSDQANWVDDKLVQRLQSRSTRPGVVALNMGHKVVSRVKQMAKPQTLVQALGQRWQSTLAAQVDQVPFVYAQPPQPEPEFAPSFRAERPAAITSKKQPVSQPVTMPVQPSPTQAQAESKLVLAPEKRPSPNPTSQPSTKPKKMQMAASTTKKNKPENEPVTTPSTTKKTTAVQQSQAESVPQSPAPPPVMTELPLPIVKAEETSAPPTAVPPPLAPRPSRAKTKGTPVDQTQTRDNSSIVVVTAPTAVPIKPKMPIAPTTTPPAQEKPEPVRIVANKPKPAAQTSLPTPSRPLVKPQPPAPKTTPTFPSATPAAPAVNGRNNSPFPNSNPLPVVNSSAAPSSPLTTAMPLPKAAPTPSPAPTAVPASSPASANGVIQRAPDDEAVAASEANSSDAGQAAVDINEIVAEVQRQFRRELAIEGERRGATSWY